MAGFGKSRPKFTRSTDAILAEELKRHIGSYIKGPNAEEQRFHNEYVRTIAYAIMDNRGFTYNQNDFMRAAGATVDYAGKAFVDFYACRVRVLEAEGMTTSDAQAVADVEGDAKIKKWWDCLDYRTQKELTA